MKYTKQAIALFLVIMTLVNTKTTPKAESLANHYGTMPEDGKYGPTPSVGLNLRREGVAPGVPVTAITNFESQINPGQVVAGSLDNTSFDASKIISAPLAAPKAEIKTSFHHEAIVKTPVHLGNQVEEKYVTTMNRVTGKVEAKVVTTQKPVLGLLNTVRGVETEHTTVVDLTTGEIAKAGPGSQKVLHGKN
jgi:hypothetical protein